MTKDNKIIQNERKWDVNRMSNRNVKYGMSNRKKGCQIERAQ